MIDCMIIGDNAFGHAISLPVELRDGGILDFGRESNNNYTRLFSRIFCLGPSLSSLNRFVYTSLVNC